MADVRLVLLHASDTSVFLDGVINVPGVVREAFASLVVLGSNRGAMSVASPSMMSKHYVQINGQN